MHYDIEIMIVMVVVVVVIIIIQYLRGEVLEMLLSDRRDVLKNVFSIEEKKRDREK